MPTVKKRAKLSVVAGGGGLEAQTRGAEDSPRGFAGKYRVLFDQASDAIITILSNGKIDAVNQAAPGPAQFDPRNYAGIVTSLGLSASDFQTCIDGTQFQKHVADDFDNAMAIGAVGTPYSVILVRGHDPIPVAGALPYAALSKVIDTALQRAATPAKN